MNSLSKDYQELINQVKALLANEDDMIANMANISAVLFNGLEDINWAGFYIYKSGELVLGPFQGQPACIRIGMGKGVCGVAAQNREALIVSNVHEFDGHIACDSRSNSEIVMPIIIKNGLKEDLIAVIDLDSPTFNRFNDDDRVFLQALVDILCSTIHT